MAALKQTFTVAGLNVEVFSNPADVKRSVGVTAFFLLHGRLGSSKSVESIAETLIRLTREEQRELIVITFDHRNHGTRQLDPRANNGWSELADVNNIRHAIDMYSIQTGTSKDISFLIDFLPAYLYPSDEQVISDWGVAGISLGGHSTWISLCSEPRIRYGIPIIGCPDFLKLMRSRAEKFGLPFSNPYFPASLLSYIHQHDPPSTPYRALDASNPFFGKKILVLSGGIDTLVPWTRSQQFVDELQVGEEGFKKVLVVPDAGHECTAAMVTEAAQFIKAEVLRVH